jgi:hypothetical protein
MNPRISLPAWVPETVKVLIQQIEQSDLTPELRLTLERMASDARMENVWGELLRRDRGSGQFVHPALQRRGSHYNSKNDAQIVALGEIFDFVFIAARDRMIVTKPAEILRHKSDLLENAKRLRMLANDLDLARSTGQLGVADPLSKTLAEADVMALHHVANWLDHLASALRRPDSPLMVKNTRGDPVGRGVQIFIATKLEEIFGSRLDGTAATLASVALGIKTSARVSRSALSKRKSSKKAGS